MPNGSKNIAQTHTVEEFISRKFEDELTYRNFSIVDYADGIELLDRNLLADYLIEIDKVCSYYTFTAAEYRKYRYAPDLLSYDLYRTTQLDFMIMIINDMVDPKEFNRKVLKLPNGIHLKNILSSILSVNDGFKEQNRADHNLSY